MDNLGTTFSTYWLEDLKQEIVGAIRHEVAESSMQTQNIKFVLGNFRTLNGLPICFYCKRVGHVKKYCRKRQSIFESNRKDYQLLPEKYQLPRSSSLVIEDQLAAATNSQKTEHREDQGLNQDDDCVLNVLQSCMRLRNIADEFLKSLETQRLHLIENGTEFDMSEAPIVREALLTVVNKISVANKILVPPSQRSVKMKTDVVSNSYGPMMLLPPARTGLACGAEKTPPENWFT